MLRLIVRGIGGHLWYGGFGLFHRTWSKHFVTCLDNQRIPPTHVNDILHVLVCDCDVAGVIIEHLDGGFVVETVILVQSKGAHCLKNKNNKSSS